MADSPPTATKLVRLLLRPAIRLALRSGLLLQDLIQIAKEVYIEVAEPELRRTTAKINVSRLSVMTGVHRQDVTKIFKERESLVEQSPPTLLGKVISTWSQSPKYLTTAGQPRVLDCEGAGSEFWRLVESISTTINPGTLIFELMRNGAARRTNRGLKLVRQTVAAGVYPDKAFELLGRDIETLTLTVEDNVRFQNQDNHAHYRTEYDNIILRDIPEVRAWIVERSRTFHRDLRDYLSKHDADYALERVPSDQAGGKITVCSFAYAEPALFEAEAEDGASKPAAKPKVGRK